MVIVSVCGCISLSPVLLHMILEPVACLLPNLTDGRGLRDGKFLQVS